MDKNKLKKQTEAIMVDLMYELANTLLARVRSGEATSQDMANAIKLLNANGITVAIREAEPLGVLKEDLPFETDYVTVSINSDGESQVLM